MDIRIGPQSHDCHPMDREIVRLIANGKSIPEIVLILSNEAPLKPTCIRKRVERLMERWQVYRQPHLVAKALKAGFISMEDVG